MILVGIAPPQPFFKDLKDPAQSGSFCVRIMSDFALPPEPRDKAGFAGISIENRSSQSDCPNSCYDFRSSLNLSVG